MEKPCISHQIMDSNKKSTTSICEYPEHPKLFSTDRGVYFCPFCKKEAPSAYNIAKDMGFDLYDYQEEILGEDGHRVLVGARQVGKTFIADLEAAAKSNIGNTIYLKMKRGSIPAIGYMELANLSEYHNLSKILMGQFDKAEFLVIDDVNHIEDIQEIHNLRIPKNFESSLICGTPHDNGILEHLAEFDWGQEVWTIPAKKSPNWNPSDIGIARQRMNPESEKREIEAKFV